MRNTVCFPGLEDGTLGLISIDALAKIGHACGHNLIAIVSLAGALATARVINDEKLGGKVMLFGTPAEGL